MEEETDWAEARGRVCSVMFQNGATMTLKVRLRAPSAKLASCIP